MRLTKKDAAVVALAKLGGATHVIETEDAAIAAHAIDRNAFGWKKYTDRVDLDAVRTTLRHEGEGREPRVEGSIQHGWHLTPRGVAWIEANQSLLEGAQINIAATPAATQRWRAETRVTGAGVNRIRTSEAFRRWTEGGEFTPRQAADVFRIDEYTPAKDRTRRATQLQELIRGDEELEAFMRQVIPAALALRAPIARLKEADE